MSDETVDPGMVRRRRRRRNYAFLILAAGIFLFGIAAGSLYLWLKPTTLRIAVGAVAHGDAEALVAMQAGADAVLREALECYEDVAIEEGDLSAIGLALEQFHQAVMDRRMTIGGVTDLLRKRAV